MSDDPRQTPPEGSVPPVEDPFLADDPEAYERERRRLQREAKRRERSGRKSLASRVTGALDGAAGKGREAIEHTKERAARTDPPADGAEPPSFRRPAPTAGLTSPGGTEPDPEQPPPSQGPSDPGRMSADALMPRRPGRRQADPPDVAPEPVAPEPVAPVEPEPAALAAPAAEDHDWFADPDADGAPPPEIPPERRAVATGDYPPLPPHSTPPPGATRGIWVRRLIALGIIVLLAVAAYVVVKKLGNDEPAPAPKGKAIKTSDITIPEGYTRSQIADVAKKAGLKGDYEKETAKAPKGFDIAKTGAPGDASLEGFLFPSTYNLEKGSSVDALIKDQLSTFNKEFDQVNTSEAKKKNLTEYDLVIIASMIEREVLVPEERPIVASVIYNRLSQGIPLGIDATLRYALDNFDKPLTESDLATDSPYNTRLVQGLPPTPIANPGLESLKAAANPAKDNYLYYVVKPDTCGEHYFTDNYDDFLAASDKYSAAQEAQGGAPTKC